MNATTCKNCEGTGLIKGYSIECFDCNGTGVILENKQYGEFF